MSCLEHIIGITERDCTCFDAQPGTWATINESKSGYYLDNYDWTVPLKGSILDDCESTGFWSVMQKCRLDGLRDLRSHFMLEVGNYQTSTFGNIKDTIGQFKTANTNFATLSQDIIGIKLVPKYKMATVLRVKELNLTIDTAQSYTISLYDQEFNLLESQAISAVSNTRTTVAVDWEIIMDGQYDAFYLVYDRLGGLPYDIKLDCGCTASSPQYMNYLDTKGIYASSVGTLDTGTKTGYTYGLEVDFSFQCDYWAWMCSMYDEFWIDTEFGRLFSKLYQMYASSKLNNYIAKRPKIDVYTVLKKEELLNLNRKLSKDLAQLVPQLALRLPNEFSDCFNCKGYGNMKRQENVY